MSSSARKTSRNCTGVLQPVSVSSVRHTTVSASHRTLSHIRRIAVNRAGCIPVCDQESVVSDSIHKEHASTLPAILLAEGRSDDKYKYETRERT